MKILVIGGSGFVGSHTCDELSKMGHLVTIYDRVKSSWLSKNQKMIVGDITDEKSIFEAVKGIDIVYNFAGLSDLNEALSKPLETVRMNILGNVIALEACRSQEVKRYIYASTVYVYSRKGGFYRCSKQSAELYVEEYNQQYGLNYTILRYGSLYGPRSDERNGLWRIIKKTLETGQICFDGDPESMREFIHVEDAAKASVHIIDEQFCNQNIVLTGQEPMKIIDLLNMLAEIFGLSQKSIKFSAKNQNHYVRTPYAYEPKIGLKYVPPFHVDLGQGLLQMIDIIKNSNIHQ